MSSDAPYWASYAARPVWVVQLETYGLEAR
jgi:hypothetical protein